MRKVFTRAGQFSAQTRRRMRVTVLVTTAAILAACSAEPTMAPELTASRGLLGSTIGRLGNTLSTVTGLLRIVPLSRPVTRSVTVTRNAGGELHIPETGLRLSVPAGAITTDRLTITVTALPGRAVAYEFQPHGTQFAKPLVFSQELGATSWLLSVLKPSLKGGYFKDADQLNTQTGVAEIDEELAATVLDGKVRFDIRHFSGYMVSTGRSSKSRASVE